MSEKGECPGGIRPGELSGYRLACFLSQSNAFFGERYYVSDHLMAWIVRLSSVTLLHRTQIFYGRPLSVSGCPCYILPMFFYLFFMAALFSGPG